MKGILAYFRFLINGQRLIFFLFTLLNCFLAISKSLSLLLLLPLFQQVSSATSPPKNMLPFLERFINFSSYQSIILAMFLLICLQTLVKIVQNRLAIQLTENFILNEKSDFLHLLKNCNWLYFKQQKSSNFYHSFLNQIDYLGNSLHRFSILIEALFLSIFYSISVIFLAKQISLYIFLGLVPLVFFHAFLFYKSRILGQQENENASQEIELFKEQLSQLKSLKLSPKQDTYFSNFNSFLQRLKKMNTQQAQLQNLSAVYFDLLLFCSFAFIFYLLPSDAMLSLPKMGVILLFLIRLTPIFNRLLSACVNLINAYPFYQSYLKTKVDLTKNQEKKYVSVQQEFKSFNIQINEITFSYAKDEHLIENFSCQIKNNQINVLIGPSGSGKTTFIELLIGLIKAHSGEIFVDDILLNETKIKSFQKEISYVPQQVELLNASIHENLCFLQEDIKEEEIFNIIHECQAFSFLNTLPQGLQTITGENGIQLSGGERQRIAILKALLKKPSFLILDEATNSIDEENELYIFEYLKSKLDSMTILLVSHRKQLQKLAQHKIYITKTD